MNIFQSILQRRDNRRRADIARSVEEDIQVREFHGNLYLAYRGVPLVIQDGLNGDIAKGVAEARKAATDYHLEKENLQ